MRRRQIDVDWLRTRLREAIALRERVCDTRFHRLVHAEADRLPGLVIDRYDDVAVVQANTAGMDRLTPLIVEALTELLPLRAVVARNDSATRRQEGLSEDVALLFGEDARAEVVEGGVRFPVDPLEGQKTGWFFDQRPNRDRVAALADGARVLDVFCHVGAFGLRCAVAGAREVTLVDSSAPALAQAEQAAALNGVAERVHVRRGDAFDVMTGLAGERFDIVVCDPPAFARSRKDAEAGLRAYGRMARSGGAPGDAGRVPVRCLVQLPRAAGGVERTDRFRAASRAAGGADCVYRRRGSGPSGASASAGDRVSEGTVDPGAVRARTLVGTRVMVG